MGEHNRGQKLVELYSVTDEAHRECDSHAGILRLITAVGQIF